MSDTGTRAEVVEKIAQAVERHQRKKQAAYERNPRYHPPDHRYALVPQMLRSLAADNEALRAQLAAAQAQVQTARNALKSSREVHCSIAEYILEEKGIRPINGTAIFADSQRARLAIDAALIDKETT